MVKKLPIFLLLILTAFLLWTHFRPIDKTADSTPEMPITAEVDPEAIATLRLNFPEETLHLDWLEPLWMIREWAFPAEQNYVTSLFNALFRTKTGVVIAQNPEDPSIYGLDPDQAKTVTLLDGQQQPLFEIHVGKSAANYQTVYFRIGSSTQVRVAASNLFPALSRPTWGNRTVWDIEPEQIIEISCLGTPWDFHIRRQDDHWQVISPSQVSLNPLFDAEILPKIAALRSANTLFKRLTERGDATAEITLRTTNSSHRLHLDFAKDGYVTATKPSEPVTYILGNRWLSQLKSAISP